jgi:radical SAM superfamily enzyme YgiQ (UPF0313 family)
VINPDVKIIIGGPHASVADKELLKQYSDIIDIVIRGEGEETFRQLISNNFEELKNIEGLTWAEKKEIYATPSRPIMSSLDQYCLKDREMFDWWLYPGFYPYGDGPNFGLISTRGCPFSCRFCSSAKVFGKKHRRRNVDSVIDEIENLKNMYGAKEVSFFDDLFTANKIWLSEFCHKLMARKINIAWKCLSRIDTVNFELLSLMKQAGCWLICYGIESGDQNILKKIDKKLDLNMAREILKATKKAGINAFHFYMIGHAGEQPENFFNTIAFAKETAPDIYQLGITTPFPGSRIYEDYKEFSIEKYGDCDYRMSKFSKNDCPSAGCFMTLGVMEDLIEMFTSEVRAVGSKNWLEFSLSNKYKASFDCIHKTPTSVSVKITNLGTEYWSESKQIRIGIKEKDQHNSIVSEERIYLDQNLKKNDSYTVEIVIKKGICVLEIDMVKENQFWFGDIQDSSIVIQQLA